jgi:transporter family-2 protein
MIGVALLAVLGGVLVGLSRQVNGRLALGTGAMTASFWNHLVGFGALCLLGVSGWGLAGWGIRGGDWPDFGAVPAWAWLGGPVGVVFVAAGSWLILRIGAAATALLVIAGQMVFGVALDLWLGVARQLALDALGVALILAGAALTLRGGGRRE